MKKNLLFVLAAALMMAACSKQEAIESAPAIPTVKTYMSNMRSYEEALRIAENAIGMLEDSKSSTRSTENRRKIDLSENKVIMRDAKTRGESGASDSLIYVFNFENNEGFALVSASKNTEGLLAVTEQGQCDPEIPSGIGGFDMFVNMAKDYVLRGMESSGSFEEIKDTVFVLSTSKVGPFVSVKWGQDHTEGYCCDNQLSGCANTAMAQIMSYYGYPTSIRLTYKGNNVINLDWNKIRNHKTKHDFENCSDTTTHISISSLLRELGNLNNSSYADGYTSTQSLSIVQYTYDGLRYSCNEKWEDKYDGAYCRSELNNHHLIHVSAFEANTSLNGHDWVFDGYMTENCIVRTMYNTGNGWAYTGDSFPLNIYYNHYNWGWRGYNNGFFLEKIYQIKEDPYYDGKSQKDNSNYNLYDSVNMLSVHPR